MPWSGKRCRATDMGSGPENDGIRARARAARAGSAPHRAGQHSNSAGRHLRSGGSKGGSRGSGAPPHGSRRRAAADGGLRRAVTPAKGSSGSGGAIGPRLPRRRPTLGRVQPRPGTIGDSDRRSPPARARRGSAAFPRIPDSAGPAFELVSHRQVVERGRQAEARDRRAIARIEKPGTSELAAC